jgi:membrane protein DedA with SNARE-associated domain
MPDAFEAFAEEYAHYGYPVLFAGVLLENVGVPVPGETALLAAGVLSSPAGGGRLDLFLVIVVATVAAILGDNVGFRLGESFARPRLAHGKGFFVLNASSLRFAEAYFQKYGAWTVFFARFFAGLRIFGALAAGASGMPWRTFFLANSAGALVWATTIASLGYFFGSSWELLHLWLGRGGLVLLACVAVLAGLPLLRKHFRRLRSEGEPLRVGGETLYAAGVVALEAVCIAALLTLARMQHVPSLDRRVEEWIAAIHVPWLDGPATAWTLLGTLPVLATIATVGCVLAWRHGRPIRERVFLAGTLAVTEAIGLLLVGLMHYRQVELTTSTVWPFGFAGLIPMRAASTWGAAAVLLGRWSSHLTTARAVYAVATLLVATIACAVFWLGQQTLTETFLDCAAGGIVLYAALRWLDPPLAAAEIPSPSSPRAKHLTPG